MWLEMDGFIDAQLELESVGGTIELDDVVLRYCVPAMHGMSWMGMDRKAEPVPAGTASGNVSDGRSIIWRWSQAHRSSSAWAGSAEAGVRLHLKGASPLWNSPAVDPSLLPPVEWGGLSGSGGCNLTTRSDGSVDIAAFAGPTTLRTGTSGNATTLHFDLLITPFKTADQRQHWSLRHFQVGYPDSK